MPVGLPTGSAEGLRASTIYPCTGVTEMASNAGLPARGTLMRQRRGFTLIEVLMVITIVGVLLGVVVPRYGAISGAMSVHSAKQELASMLAQGRASAIQ